MDKDKTLLEKESGDKIKNRILCKIEKLELQLVSKSATLRYGDLDIYENDYILLSGDNGSGKSTFFKAMRICVENDGKSYYLATKESSIKYRHELGENHIDESKDILESGIDKTKVRETVVLIQQEDEAIDGISVWDKLYRAYSESVKSKYSGKSNAKRRADVLAEGDVLLKQYVQSYLTRVFRDDIKGKGDNFANIKKILKRKRFSKCSGGQKKIVCIMSQLIKMECLDSQILLMDEPLNNLDREMKTVVSNLIEEARSRKLQARKSDPSIIVPAVIIISHCNIFLGINKHVHISKEEGGFVVVSNNVKPQRCLLNNNVSISADGTLYLQSK